VAINPGSIDAGVGIGEIFVDKYRVDGILGHGGMGVVALCTHLALNEQVAIKMLRKDVLDDADAVERFMREAQAAVKLKSEYVARVTDVGRSRTNVPYMVMEYLEGHDLGELLDEQGKLTLSLAVELTLQACEALAEAHSIQIVHRDVKPTNLFVTWRPDGSVMVKVLDFGISKALSKTDTSMALTQTQSLLGTPAYMSPEQMRSARHVDARTDIWSLGTVLYELLEGHRPFEAESFSEMCVKVAVDPPGAMTQTPAALQQVVMRCLEKTPDDRYASMADLARDLAPFAHDRHQAGVLVERATRMLRLSGVQSIVRSPTSSGNSGPLRKPASGEQLAETAPVRAAGSGTAIPLPAGDARSGSATAISLPAADVATGAGVAIPLSPAELTTATAIGPSPAMPPTAVALPPRAEFRAGSGPAFSETLAVVRQPRRTALWIATALIACAALGAAISLARSPSEPPAASHGATPAAAEAKPTESGAPARVPAAPPSPSETAAAPPKNPAAPSAGTTAEPPGSDGDSAAADAGPSKEDLVFEAHPEIRAAGPAKKRHSSKRPGKQPKSPQQLAPAATTSAPSVSPGVLPAGGDDPCVFEMHSVACTQKREALSKGAAAEPTATPPR
jgi:serine/threonine-protein kinase